MADTKQHTRHSGRKKPPEPNETELLAGTTTSNFDADDVEPNLIEKVKGDAIGNTLYSQRFVLQTLMKLTKLEKPVSEDEDFEKDLCTLWDQTVEPDVVKFLLEQECMLLFVSVMDTEFDPRLTEILVGIIANACALPEARLELEIDPHSTPALIRLISSTDPLILVQLMRLFQAMLVFENRGDEICWFQYFAVVEDFVEKFAFVLASSTSNTLLKHSFEALYAICAKFAVIEIMPESGNVKTTFIDMFVTTPLITGMIEAFRQVLGNNSDYSETMSLPTENEIKFMSLFLDVNVILSQYKEKSQLAYSEHLKDFLECLSRILAPLTNPIYLLPLTTIHQGVIENCSDILQALDYPMHPGMFKNLTILFNLLAESKPKQKERTSEWDDGDSVDINFDELQCTVLDCLTKVSNKLNDIDEIQRLLGNKVVTTFLDGVKSCEHEDTIIGLNDFIEGLEQSLEEKRTEKF